MMAIANEVKWNDPHVQAWSNRHVCALGGVWHTHTTKGECKICATRASFAVTSADKVPTWSLGWMELNSSILNHFCCSLEILAQVSYWAPCDKRQNPFFSSFLKKWWAVVLICAHHSLFVCLRVCVCARVRSCSTVVLTLTESRDDSSSSSRETWFLYCPAHMTGWCCVCATFTHPPTHTHTHLRTVSPGT